MNRPNSIPAVARKPESLTAHGDTRIDPYYWLKDRENPEVLDYLRAENEYASAQLRDTDPLRETLFQEMKARIKEEDESAPYRRMGYWYFRRYRKGQEYPVYLRRADKPGAEEVILFDVNAMAEGHAYYHLGGLGISPDNQMIAFGFDAVSRRIYTLQVKDLRTGEILPDTIENTTGAAVWADDDRTFFYTRKDETLRPYRVYRHKLGTHPDTDVLVYEEKEPSFSVFIYRTKSRKYIVLGSSSTLSREYRILCADDPNGVFRVFQPREKDLEYDICHFEDRFYILTNKGGATNFKVMKTPEAHTSQEHWVEIIPHRTDTLIEDLDVFKDYLVVEERHCGLTQINIRPWQAEPYYIPFDEETYCAELGENYDFDTPLLRYGYTSLTTPNSIFDFDMKTRKHILRKRQTVLGDFDEQGYASRRIWVTARDGKAVPVSLVYKKSTLPSPESPLLLYGYGSYGITVDPSFSSTRLSLLNRGFTYAIAHIRGGQYLGRPWYEAGKLLNKKNTFTDFIDVADSLVDQQYTAPQHLYAMGGSAGGLLMGAVINQAPEHFHGVIAQVPFVDVVTTMLDESIPLTIGEYDEWGNPNDPEYYAYIKSYSPYDNVVQQTYPHLLVTTGLHDPQVQYWEPAKWVARLRELKKGDRLLLLKTDMDTGHGGASGRFEPLKETAMEYAFLLHLEGITS